MYDIIVIGSGVVGLVNALLLAQNNRDLRLAVLDAKAFTPTWSAAAYDSRVYALTPASQRVLSDIGIWQDLKARRISPFTQMSVWDPESGGELHFDHRDFNVPALGHVVEENLIRETLLEKLKTCPQLELLSPVMLNAIQEHEGHIELCFNNAEGRDSDLIRTRLLVGADGAKSWVREKTQLPLRVHDYQHSALIAQVETKLPHQNRARQCFLSGKRYPAGPLAFLPLQESHQSSIVWSTQPEKAEELLKMADGAFQKILGEAFGFRLGEVTAISKRAVYPLYERHAKAYVKERVALIGDAVHTLHPLAGQGMNLGIADAACLAAVVTEAIKKNRDFSSKAVLRRYERARKGNNLIMLGAVKFLKTIFASEMKSTQFLRGQGLRISNRLTLLKTFFAHYAMG